MSASIRTLDISARIDDRSRYISTDASSRLQIREENQIIEVVLVRRAGLINIFGQEKIKRTLNILLELTQAPRSVDHVLLYRGAPCWARRRCAILSRRMAYGFAHDPRARRSSTRRLASILTRPAGEVLFIDEIHRLQRAVEERLYSANEDFCAGM